MSASCPASAGAVAPPLRPALSLAEVLRAGLPGYAKARALLPQQWKVLRAILACRTPALGAHCYRCRDCGRDHVRLHSCRNRHCPRCQGSLAAAWLEKQQDALLPVPYFHLVFTLPHCLNPLIRQNRAALYKLLLDCSAQTLLEFGRRRWGGQLGITSVLHTWGQALTDHYHVHCIVTGGALTEKGWRGASPHFLFPVRALSKVFQGKFCSAVEKLLAAHALALHGEVKTLSEPASRPRLLRQAVATKWVVYAKRPFAGPLPVLNYLSLYTHRVALSERRLLALNPTPASVSFSYKDYADGARRKVMTLALDEFIRRFLLHLLPERFVKIRHYGILGNHRRQQRLQHIRSLLHSSAPTAPQAPKTLSTATRAALIRILAHSTAEPGPIRCPFCNSDRISLIRVIHPARRVAKLDSS